MSQGFLYQVKWLTVVRDCLAPKSQPHQHLHHYFVFIKDLHVQQSRGRQCSLEAWLILLELQGMEYCTSYKVVGTKLPRAHPCLCFFLGTKWAQTCPSFLTVRWAKSWGFADGIKGKYDPTWALLINPPYSLLFLACRIQTTQWRTLRFRGSCPIELSGMMGNFYSSLFNRVVSHHMWQLCTGNVSSATEEVNVYSW